MAAPKGIVIKDKSKKPYQGSRPSRAMRTAKMIAPRCAVHFPGDNSVSPFSNWVANCEAEGHNPYVRVNTVENRRPKLETQEDGRVLVVGEEVELEYHENPNWEQVPDELGVYSGRGVANSQARHYKFPEELGYAPFCDYYNCGEQNPKFNTRFGRYHSRQEAALIALRLDYGPQNETEVQFNQGTDQRRADRQLRDKMAEEGISR